MVDGLTEVEVVRFHYFVEIFFMGVELEILDLDLEDHESEDEVIVEMVGSCFCVPRTAQT